MQPGWDREFATKLRKLGIQPHLAMKVVGLVAEERMGADRIGYQRGYNEGHRKGYDSAVRKGLDKDA